MFMHPRLAETATWLAPKRRHAVDTAPIQTDNPQPFFSRDSAFPQACGNDLPLADKIVSDSGEVSEWLKEHAWKVCIR